MSKNILIVESENDKYFIEALIKHLNLPYIDVDPPICSIDEYECLGGMSKLKGKLLDIQERIAEDGIEKIGIILDADKAGIPERIKLINEALQIIDENLHLNVCNNFVTSKALDVEIACYIMNIDGFGELETVLKAIKSHDSTYADCLNIWKECLEQKNKTIKDKYFDKFWVNTYQRYDCCTKKEQNDAGKKCNFAISMKKDIWNFESDKLNELKNFLNLFKTKTV